MHVHLPLCVVVLGALGVSPLPPYIEALICEFVIIDVKATLVLGELVERGSVPTGQTCPLSQAPFYSSYFFPLSQPVCCNPPLHHATQQTYSFPTKNKKKTIK